MAHTLRGWASTWPMHQHTQTADGDLPDSVRLQSAALHSASRQPMTRSIVSPLCCIPFHSLNPAETGREDAHFARPLRVSCRCRQLDSATALNWKSLCSSGWHERNDQVLRCSFLRACELGLASFLSHKSHYVHSRPSTGTRSRRTPGDWVPAVSRLPTNPSDGPIE